MYVCFVAAKAPFACANMSAYRRLVLGRARNKRGAIVEETQKTGRVDDSARERAAKKCSQRWSERQRGESRERGLLQQRRPTSSNIDRGEVDLSVRPVVLVTVLRKVVQLRRAAGREAATSSSCGARVGAVGLARRGASGVNGVRVTSR